MTESTWPSPKVLPITPSDSVNFTDEVRQIYVGTGGNIAVVNQDNSVVVFQGVLGGTVLGPFFIKRVNATSTTATNLVGFI